MSTLKELTRLHRGSGCVLKSLDKSATKKWNNFFREAKNRIELFNFLTEKMTTMEIPENKEIFITSEDRVVCKRTENEMPQCNHEEPNTRIIIQVEDSLQRGTNTIMIHIVDTNIIVLLIGHFYAL